MDYPKQETSATIRSTVCYRDVITIRRDNAPGGATQPDYSNVLHTNLLCEVLQVSGGEIIRGKQVEARTSFVVTCDFRSDVDQRCEVQIHTGPYSGRRLYVGRSHVETSRSRPVRMQLHCSESRQP